MRISEKLVRAFQEAHECKFSQNISAEEAERDLSDLAELVRIIIKER